MRLGGPVFGDVSTPELWVAAVQNQGYRATYCPLDAKADDVRVGAYVEAAAQADIIIAEVGAWSNPISTNEETRRAAIALCQQQLDLAERIGALCCVNIAGSRGEQWDGPHPDNLTSATFDLVVETVREIIDAVKPQRTCYTLETMPWAFPEGPDSYLELIKAIDRPGFAVHFDPVNLISSPQRYFDNAGFLRDCFAKLGPWIKSCHAKDILIAPRLTVHLDEVRPGLGVLDYRTFLHEVRLLNPEIPVLLEHLPNADEYVLAADYIRSVAAEL
ncbi:MAG: Xylose isomerase protein barrel [Chthonomonadales bacterium]|nr:Xylose isomerase protein barrel [Chthonomonadales bacterium]